MTKQEQQQLKVIIARLETIHQKVPSKATYTRGRADSSITSQLLSVIRELREVVSSESTATEKK